MYTDALEPSDQTHISKLTAKIQLMNVNCAISNFPGRAHTKQTKTSATSLAMLRQARTLRLHQRQEAPPPHPAELNSTDLPPPMPNRLHRRRPRPSARKQPSSLSTTLTSTARTRLPHKLTWGSSSRSYAYLARSDLFVCLLLHVFIVLYQIDFSTREACGDWIWCY
jgi:hypothetical protein